MLASVSTSARNLGGLRGFASYRHNDGSHSPRVRKLRIEDLLPAPDDEGKRASRAVRFTKVSKPSVCSYAEGHAWYTCLGTRVFFPLLTMSVTTVFLIGCALFLWEYRSPKCELGAFGKLAQNTRPESVQEANFVKARGRAVSGPSLLSGLDGLDEDNTTDSLLGAAQGFEWRRVELVYQERNLDFLETAELRRRCEQARIEDFGTKACREASRESIIAILQKHDSSIVKEGMLASANQFELSLKEMPGWKKLCNQRVPQAARNYCDHGDSFAAVMFGTAETATPSEIKQGVLTTSIFNGRGNEALMPLPSLLEHLTNTAPEVFRQWLEIDVTKTSVNQTTAMRSLFAFYLPHAFLGEWADFVQDLEVKLKASAKQGIGGATLFYRANGVSLEEDWNYAVDNAVMWACVAGLGAFLSTALITRRILLGWAAMLLAGVASATASSLVSKYHEDGFVEFPAVAITTWFINAANSADLAIACISAWELDDPFPDTTFAELCRVISDRLDSMDMPPPHRKWKVAGYQIGQRFNRILKKAFPQREEDSPAFTPLTDWYPIGRLYWYLINLMLAPLVNGFVFVIIASQTELLLLQEFATHVGAGLIVSSLFSALLYPPVIDLGDVLNDMSLGCNCLRRINEKQIPNLIELGAHPDWTKWLRAHIEVFASMLNGRWMRIISLVLAAGVITAFSFSKFTSSFVPEAPSLFPPGHRSREGPKVRELFGQLPRHLEAPKPLLSGARKCVADADDSADCSWFECEIAQGEVVQEGMCVCGYRPQQHISTTQTTTMTIFGNLPQANTEAPFKLPSSIGQTGTCSAVARVAGVPKASQSDFPQADFWKWAEEQVGTTLGDGSNQVLEPQRIGSLEMEDWATGAFLVRSQFSMGQQIANEDMPKFEEACISILCYCDVAPCGNVGADWKRFGQGYQYKTTDVVATSSPDAGARRMDSQDLGHPLGGYRRLADVKVKQLQDVNIIWGLFKSEQIPFRTSDNDLKFVRNFEIKDPWTQRAMLSFCEGVAPNLKVVSTQCWVLDFRRWLAGHGESYPIRPGMFYASFFQYATYRSGNLEVASAAEGGGASGGSGYDYFWLAESGRIRGSFATFKVDAPAVSAASRSELNELLRAWSLYVWKRNALSDGDSADAWMASPLFAASQTAEIVRNSCYLAMGTLVIVTGTTVLILTCSPGITVAYTVVLLLAICTFASFWTGLGVNNIGSMELVSLSVFLSGLTIPLIRVANAYAYARDRPHLPAEMMLGTTLSEAADRGLRTSSTNLNIDALKELAKQHAEEQDQILMFPGAINNERQQRVATALQRGGAASVGLFAAGAIAGITLAPIEMEGLGQVGLSILCMAFSIPVAISFLSLLLLLGLGDSKARLRALQEMARWFWGRLSGKVRDSDGGLLDGRTEETRRTGVSTSPLSFVDNNLRASAEGSCSKPHHVAAMMLGAPSRFTTSKATKVVEEEQQKPMDDVGSEEGPCIRTLDVQGATAKPPYHVVLATSDPINVKG